MTTTPSSEFEVDGHAGRIVARSWEAATPSYLAVLVHGYGEHIGRYEWVASRLTADGAAVYGPDHVGHGRSEGDRVVVEDFEGVVDDVRLVVQHAQDEHPGLPVVLIGHSMGGMISARYAQRFGAELACVVLSGPVIGGWQAVTDLLAAQEIPDVPIEPSTLSRDASVGEAYVADDLVWHGPFKRPTLESLQRTIDTINDAGVIDSVPVQWLHGEEDHLVPIGPSREGWAKIAGPKSQQRTYPGARHEIFNETNKDEVVGDVIAFIHGNLPDA